MKFRTLVTVAVLWLGAIVPALAQETRLQGTISDADGNPIPLCRVVVRQAEGVAVWVSAPSDEVGRYILDVPMGDSYVLVALVSPTGGRTALPGEQLLQATDAALTQDILLPMAMGPSPRKPPKSSQDVDRFFLQFVEDPAITGRQRYEAQFDGAGFKTGDILGLRGIGTWQIRSLPQTEVGARVGFAHMSPNGASSKSGLLDSDAWAKLLFYRSADTRLALAAGAFVTFPTGDYKAGLGRDSLQSKLFVSGSYALRSALLVGHVGLRAVGDGNFDGVPLTGRTSGAAGFGAMIVFSDDFTGVAEIDYSGKRFDQSKNESRLLFGMNWRRRPNRTLRAAIAAGLTDGSPDIELIVGYVWAF